VDETQRRAKLQELHDLAQGSEEFDGGVTWEPESEALVVGNWAFFAIDDDRIVFESDTGAEFEDGKP
jgi:hypothetical protein